MDIGQIHAIWMGLSKRLTLANENLVKYKKQFCSPLPEENIAMLTSPISTDVGNYDAMEDLDDLDLQLRYFYDNVPHHQDQMKSPQKLKDRTPWSDILSFPNNPLNTLSHRLPTITEYSTREQESKEDEQRRKGKR